MFSSCLFVPATIMLLAQPAPVSPQGKTPRITVGKQTTVITEPVDADGYINYVQAIDKELRDGVTPENNANVPLRLMLGEREIGPELRMQYYGMLGIPVPENPQARVVSQGDMLQQFGRDKTGELTKATTEPWIRSDSKLAATWIARNADVFSAIRTAAARPKFYSPTLPNDGRMTEVLLPDVQNLRIYARLLLADAMLNLGTGKEGAALDDLLACHRLSAHVGNGWTLVELLVSCAIENMTLRAEEAYLNHARPTKGKHAFWNRKLATVRSVKTTAQLVDKTERYVLLDTMTSIARGKDLNKMLQMIGGGETLQAPVAIALKLRVKNPKIDFDQILINSNKHMDEVTSILNEPDPLIKRARHDAFEKRLKERGAAAMKISAAELLTDDTKVVELLEGATLSSFTPAVLNCQTAELRCLALGDAIDVGWALSAWYGEHDAWPKTLDQLVPKYMEAIPKDRFNGKPLRFKVEQQKCRVYSVGPNLKDDNGTDLEPTASDYDIGIELRR